MLVTFIIFELKISQRSELWVDKKSQRGTLLEIPISNIVLHFLYRKCKLNSLRSTSVKTTCIIK